MQNDQPKLLSRLNPWVTLIISVGSVLTALWGALMLFNPIGKVDLTVRIEREIPVSLPSGVAALPIRLVYEGRDITRASVVQVEILNSGSTPIGEPEKDGEPKKRWKLDLRNKDGVTVVPLGAARPKPSNVKVDVVRGPSPDVVSLEIGLLNPKDSIFLELMLVEPKDGTTLPVVAETRIPGLSEPVTGKRNVRERLASAFELPIFVLLYISFLGLLLFERQQLKRLDKPLAFAHTALGVLIMPVMPAALLGFAISWGLAWFASTILTK